MSRIQTVGRWFFGIFCVASGVEAGDYVYQRVSSNHDWMAHPSAIAVAFCCFAAGIGLFTRRRWFYGPALVVAAYGILGGLMGIFFGPTISLNLPVSILSCVLGFAFVAWLRLPGVRPRSEPDNT